MNVKQLFIAGVFACCGNHFNAMNQEGVIDCSDVSVSDLNSGSDISVSDFGSLEGSPVRGVSFARDINAAQKAVASRGVAQDEVVVTEVGGVIIPVLSLESIVLSSKDILIRNRCYVVNGQVEAEGVASEFRLGEMVFDGSKGASAPVAWDEDADENGVGSDLSNATDFDTPLSYVASPKARTPESSGATPVFIGCMPTSSNAFTPVNGVTYFVDLRIQRARYIGNNGDIVVDSRVSRALFAD